MKIVKITWIDSFSIDRWQSRDLTIIEATELMECQTVGYLLKKTPEFYLVCHTMNAEGSVCGAIQIPRKCVRAVIEL